MSNNDVRVRDQIATGVLMMGQPFGDGDKEANRQAAIDWGKRAAVPGVAMDPFKPHGVGPEIFDVCHWPDGDDGLVALKDRGALPETADLDYGVELSDASFHGIKHIDQGDGRPLAFAAVVSGTVEFANKVKADGPTRSDVEDEIAKAFPPNDDE